MLSTGLSNSVAPPTALKLCCGTDSATTTAPNHINREGFAQVQRGLTPETMAVDQRYFDGLAADGYRCGLGRILKRN
jgi:hypothetical protein